jgi:hypothetical protein
VDKAHRLAEKGRVPGFRLRFAGPSSTNSRWNVPFGGSACATRC